MNKIVKPPATCCVWWEEGKVPWEDMMGSHGASLEKGPLS